MGLFSCGVSAVIEFLIMTNTVLGLVAELLERILAPMLKEKTITYVTYKQK